MCVTLRVAKRKMTKFSAVPAYYPFLRCWHSSVCRQQEIRPSFFFEGLRAELGSLASESGEFSVDSQCRRCGINNIFL